MLSKTKAAAGPKTEPAPAGCQKTIRFAEQGKQHFNFQKFILTGIGWSELPDRYRIHMLYAIVVPLFVA